MALEALCGAPRRTFMAENRLFDQEEIENKDEFLASFPNAEDPMKVLTPPFVSLYLPVTYSNFVHFGVN